VSANVETLFVSPASSIRDAVARIDRSASGIALAVDGDSRLIATITDGDVRRALLSGIDLDAPVQTLIDRKAGTPSSPTTAPVGTPRAELLEVMNRDGVRHVPLLDSTGRVVDIALLTELVLEYELPLRALVMTGGFGTRLRPLTDDRPKSMLPVGDRPLLEVIVGQLQQAGIRRVNLATHYKADVIAEHFGDGSRFSLDIEYVNEDRPLGTAGAVGLLGESAQPLLVINGDILTQINVAAMLDFHRANTADMTVAVRPFEIQVPYGVVETDGVAITRVDEKPLIRYFINAGIYLLNTNVCRLVRPGERCDMTDLIGRVMAEGLRVISFPLREYWLDIGRNEDYARAIADAEQGKV
jgi:dTDP-glucose pyrophosphorylase/CBS domain-containing protein